MEKVNYKKASTFYLVGNLFNKGIAFLTVPIFSRILSTSDYGVATTYTSWVSILTMVMGFAIYMGIRAAFIDYKEKIDDVMSVTTTFTIVSGALLSLFVGLGMILIDININIMLIVLCLLQGLASALIQNYSMYLMMLYKYKFRTLLMILPNLISVIISIGAILLILETDLYMGRIVPQALVTLGFGILTVVLVYKKSRIMYNREYLKFTLGVSAPIVLHGIALNILSQSDRTMITALADANQTGIYSLIYNFSMLATVITTSLDGVWVPWFTEKLKKRELNDINMLAKDYIHLMTYSMSSLILVGPEIVKLLADEKYWEGIVIIPPVVLANYVIFAYTLYVNIEHFHKKTRFITANTLIAAGTNLVLNFLLIPKYGYVAAAYTTLVSYLVAFLLHARYAKKLEKDLYPLKHFVDSLVHILIAVLMFYVLMDSPIVRWGGMVVYVLAMIYKERNRLQSFFPSIAKKFKK